MSEGERGGEREKQLKSGMKRYCILIARGFFNTTKKYPAIKEILKLTLLRMIIYRY